MLSFEVGVLSSLAFLMGAAARGRTRNANGSVNFKDIDGTTRTAPQESPEMPHLLSGHCVHLSNLRDCSLRFITEDMVLQIPVIHCSSSHDENESNSLCFQVRDGDHGG